METYKAIRKKRVQVSKKFFASVPSLVAEKVKFLAENYGIKSLTLDTITEGYQYSAGEGQKVVVVYGNESRGVEMVSQNSLGAAGVCHDIGARTPPLPAGAWLIVISYYTKYWMTVSNVVPKRLGG